MKEDGASEQGLVAFRSFTGEDALSNIVLEVDGTELYVHKEV